MDDGPESIVGTWVRQRVFTGGGLFKELELRSDGSFRYDARFVENDTVLSSVVVEGAWHLDILSSKFYETTTSWNGATANEKSVLTVAVANGVALTLLDTHRVTSPLAAEWVRRTS